MPIGVPYVYDIDINMDSIFHRSVDMHMDMDMDMNNIHPALLAGVLIPPALPNTGRYRWRIRRDRAQKRIGDENGRGDGRHINIYGGNTSPEAEVRKIMRWKYVSSPLHPIVDEEERPRPD